MSPEQTPRPWGRPCRCWAQLQGWGTGLSCGVHRGALPWVLGRMWRCGRRAFWDCGLAVISVVGVLCISEGQGRGCKEGVLGLGRPGLGAQTAGQASLTSPLSLLCWVTACSCESFKVVKQDNSPQMSQELSLKLAGRGGLCLRATCGV